MKKNALVLISTFSLFAMPAIAGWNVSGSYSSLSEDTDLIDVTLATVNLGVGYEFRNEGSKFSWMPEIRFGVGVGDDSVDDGFGGEVELEADRFTSFGIRGTYYISNNISAFVQAAQAELDVNVKNNNIEVTGNGDEFGYGIGLSYFPSKNTALEITYEDFDVVSVISAGFRYSF